MPPPSMATFQVRPQSLRLIVVLPSKPARVLPNGSGEEPWNSRSSTTGRAWPLIVELAVQLVLVVG